MNEKYSDPLEEIMFELSFCRYPMRHGAETIDSVGKGAAVLSAGIAAERVVELAAEGTVVGTFVLVFQV